MLGFDMEGFAEIDSRTMSFEFAARAGIGFFGLAMQTIGYQKVESTATAAVMAYLEVPFVFLLQSLFFGEAADAVKLLGVTLIVASGVLNLWHGEIARIVGRRRRAEFN